MKHENVTMGTFTSVSAAQRMAHADALEAATCVMHGSACLPSYQAIKRMRRLAQNRDLAAGDPDIDWRGLVDELRRMANTVARPARDQMQADVRLLSIVIDEKKLGPQSSVVERSVE